MVEFLYEKDLRGMQYNILISTRHDMLITDLGHRYGLRKQELRRKLIDKMDMILLENLTARYEVGLKMGDADDELARQLGRELVTKYIPLVDAEKMEQVIEEVRIMIETGTTEEIAIEQGKTRIRELILL